MVGYEDAVVYPSMTFRRVSILGIDVNRSLEFRRIHAHCYESAYCQRGIVESRFGGKRNFDVSVQMKMMCVEMNVGTGFRPIDCAMNFMSALLSPSRLTVMLRSG